MLQPFYPFDTINSHLMESRFIKVAYLPMKSTKGKYFTEATKTTKHNLRKKHLLRAVRET